MGPKEMNMVSPFRVNVYTNTMYTNLPNQFMRTDFCIDPYSDVTNTKVIIMKNRNAERRY